MTVEQFAARAAALPGTTVQTLSPGTVVVTRRYVPGWAKLVAAVGVLFGVISISVMDGASTGLLWFLGLAALLFPAKQSVTFSQSGDRIETVGVLWPSLEAEMAVAELTAG